MKRKKNNPACAEERLTPPAQPCACRRERRDIAIELLSPAPDNPRRDITPESVADLVASMRTIGMIEPVIVRESSADDGGYIIIAGHRRVAAAREVPLAIIPCDVMVGIDDKLARRMMYVENLQRADADPLLEANLVAQLVADGMTQIEIAAEIGRDRRWVARRQNLCALSPAWRKELLKGANYMVDCLEHIAAFPQEVQDAVCKDLHGCYNGATAARWVDVSWRFARQMRDLAHAPFETAPCRECRNNTATARDLFDACDAGCAALGKCTLQACWAKRCEEACKALMAQAEKCGAPVINGLRGGIGEMSHRRTKRCTALYVFSEAGAKCAMWGEPPPKPSDAECTVTQDDVRAARVKAREEKKLLRDALYHLRVACRTDDTLAKCLRALPCAKSALFPLAISALFSSDDGSPAEVIAAGYEYATMRDLAFEVLCNGAELPDAWYDIAAVQLSKYISDDCYAPEVCRENAGILLALIPQLRTHLEAPMLEAIGTCTVPEDVLSLASPYGDDEETEDGE